MHGAREVMEASTPHIGEQILALEKAVDENPGLAFDLAKTLLESGCRTILVDRGTGYNEAWDLPKLLHEVLAKIRLVPTELEETSEVSKSLRKTAGGLHSVIQGICELRNTHGFASHGRDAAFQQLEATQALVVARSADAVYNFLFRVHRRYTLEISSPPLTYEENPDFNQYVDETSEPVQVINLVFRPSEVLFQMDPQAYRDYLGNFKADASRPGDEKERSPDDGGPGT